MTAPADAPTMGTRAVPRPGRPPSTLGFDWLMLAVALWPLVGAMTDANAHINDPKLESFFTPWHALLYSGLFVVGGANALAMRRNHARGYPWRRALPAGYEMTLLGVAILAVAGIGDLIWHSFFGIERDIPALTSPTHILIVVGIVLILTGPLRSGFRRPRASDLTGARLLPALLSAVLTYTFLTVVLQFADPISYRWAAFGDVDLFANKPLPVDPFLPEALGVASVMISTGLLMGFVLLVVRRWRPLPGFLTVLLTLDVAAVSALDRRFDLVLFAAAAGLAGDLLLLVARPSPERRTAFRLFAFAFPVLVVSPVRF
jgi:hypothetical protein